MSYLVLARKYRPRTFADVIGQELVTGTLRGALSEGRAGHAYLFTGPRGTGKTTTARIFAKALNCERGPTAEPCGQCERCLAADAGQELDLIEIDAASHTGVDHIRDLRDQANYAPLRARFKIYLIDEVHMLSKAAFNALLKTLEEPPKHVVFLFATTELHKVLGTILSRCQVLRLEPIRSEQIAARLTHVFELEGITPEAGVVEELARRSMGGMRDALSLADQLLALSGGSPRLADLRRLAGAGEEELVRVVEALLEQRRGELLEICADWRGREAELLAALLEHLRLGLVGLLCGANSPALEGDPETIAQHVERAKRIGPERMEAWMAELLRARERLRQAVGIERAVLELTLLDLARPDLPWSYAELLERLERLESRLGSAAPGSGPAGAPAPSAAPQRAAAAATPAAPARPAASNPTPASTAGPSAPPAASAPSATLEPTPAPASLSHSQIEPRPRTSLPKVANLPAAEAEPAGLTGASSPSVSGQAASQSGAPSKPGHPPRPAGAVQPGSPSSATARANPPTASAQRGEPSPKTAAEGAESAHSRPLFQTWLERLRSQQPGLADLLRRRGRLEPEASGQRLVLRNLTGEELALVQSARNRQALERSFADLAGAGVSLRLDAAAGAEERPAPLPEEPFTKEVVDLFGGRIED